MASSSKQFDEANLARDEYEIKLYGFTVDEFTKESKIVINLFILTNAS